MKPRIIELQAKKLVGMRREMTFADHRPDELWRDFMPRRDEIANRTGNEYYSVEVYAAHFFEPFDPHRPFQKWAAIEVSEITDLPHDMETLLLPGGRYAVFHYRGTAADAPATYGYIFDTWLPKSGYTLDHRPHLAVMGDKYHPNRPDSEEDIWIPVR